MHSTGKAELQYTYDFRIYFVAEFNCKKPRIIVNGDRIIRENLQNRM
jgi:hypothetical protein